MEGLLQVNTVKLQKGSSFDAGLGAGGLQAGYAVAAVPAGLAGGKHKVRYHIAMLPYLVDNRDGTVSPALRMTVRDERLRTTSAAKIYGHIYGSTESTFTCDTALGDRVTGECTAIVGKPVPKLGSDGLPSRLAWRFTLDGAVSGDSISVTPEPLMFATDGLEAAVAGLRGDPLTQDAVLAFHFGEGSDPALGRLSEAYSVVDSGSGISTSPMGLLFTPPTLGTVASQQNVSLSGSGISTSPMGVTVLTFNGIMGSGISTSPMSLTLAVFEGATRLSGSGISTSPMGAFEVYAPGALPCSGCRFSGEPILTGSSEIVTSFDTSGTALQQQLNEGGWTNAEGYQGATLLGRTSALAGEALEISGRGASASALQALK